MKMVLFPEGNRKDLAEIPEEVKQHLKMIPVKSMDQVWSVVFEKERP